MQNSEIMTLKEASKYLKIAEKTAYRLALEAKIPGFRIGTSWRFRKHDLDKWIDKQVNNKKCIKNMRNKKNPPKFYHYFQVAEDLI